MIVGLKDSLKLIGVSILACCAVFVCTMFLNYYFDLRAVGDLVTDANAQALYDAQLLTSKVVILITGLCLALTAVVMLFFYIRHYIDAHKKQLGILKALGYADIKIASGFWTFGLSVFIGAAAGFALAFAVMPTFYATQNNEKLLPDMSVGFHGEILAYFVIIPTLIYASVAILYAYYKLKTPVIALLKDSVQYKNVKKRGNEREKTSFFTGVALNVLSGKKSLAFFIFFAAFCFSAMIQMGLSMRELASPMMEAIMIAIGVLLACTTLILAVVTAVKENAKTIALMRAYGYSQAECANAVLGVYRPFGLLGFAVGTVYQWGLLEMILALVFKNVETNYKFDFVAMAISFAVYVVVYEAILLLYALKLRKASLKQIMTE